MKMGLGFSPRNITPQNLDFARMIGVTHIMVHIPSGELMPTSKNGYWTSQDLKDLVTMVESHGLKLEAIENFEPAHWNHILTNGPKRNIQLENIKTIIKNMGAANIPIMGYNFSIAAVSGRVKKPLARGGAEVAVFDKENIADFNDPVPNGYAWGRQVEPGDGTFQNPVSLDEMWERYDWFMDNILPVAEESGVKMAIHPDDPPVPEMRQCNRLMINIDRYDRAMARHPSNAFMVEFCQGTFAEMPYGREYVYQAIDHFSALKKIAYVHFRNVKGQLPYYTEDFIDCGDTDMIRALKIYQKNGFDGMIIPDHVPTMPVSEPWVTAAAYTVGYMRALCRALDIPLE